MSTPAAIAPAQTKSPLAIVKSEVVDKTADQIRRFIDQGKFNLPPNYSVENALKSAWLILQETEDKDKRAVLTTCSQVSIVNALMAMAVQGLDPSKKQCYFIAYGQRLACQRSYFGDMALAKRVRPGIEFGYACWFEGDEIATEMVNGRKTGIRHKQDVANIVSAKILGAYCVITDANDKVLAAEIMPMEMIRKSWTKSRNLGPTHVDFVQDMALRTVIRKACKIIINSSSDAWLVEMVAEAEREAADAEMEELVALEANQVPIALPTATASVDPTTGEMLAETQEVIPF